MKATICDICGKSTPTTDKAAMLYDISIFASESCETDTKEEKSLLLDLDDCCAGCAKVVRQAITKAVADMKGSA